MVKTFKQYTKIIFLTLNDTYQTDYFGKWSEKANEIIKNETDESSIFIKVLAGDFLFPNKYSSIFYGHDMILATNSSQFHFIGIGNHEFDYGTNILTELASMSNTPFLCSNLNFDLLSQYNLKDNYCFFHNNIKIGAVSYILQETSEMSPGAKDLKFKDLKYLFETQKKFLLSLDLKILIVHDVIQNIIDYFEMNPSDKNLVDVIITGHQHIIYIGYIHRGSYKIPIIQMGEDALGLGYIELFYDNYKNIIINSLADVKIIPPNTQETTEINLLTQWVQKISSPYFQMDVGVVINYPLYGLTSTIRNQESNLGDLVADAFLQTGIESPITSFKENIFAICNSGNIRNNAILPIGFQINGEYIYTILPFNDSIVAVEIIGRSNVNTLINNLAINSLNKIGSGGWLQISKNLLFNYKTNTFELLGGTKGKTDKFYLIVNNYLAQGGDGYNELIKFNKLLIDIPIQTSLINYIEFIGGNISYTNEYTRIIL
jgi:2',3'-cyclic-nucleotide 2'-phosphodiesterase (5'-nucleotidase family)